MNYDSTQSSWMEIIRCRLMCKQVKIVYELTKTSILNSNLTLSAMNNGSSHPNGRSSLSNGRSSYSNGRSSRSGKLSYSEIFRRRIAQTRENLPRQRTKVQVYLISPSTNPSIAMKSPPESHRYIEIGVVGNAWNRSGVMGRDLKSDMRPIGIYRNIQTNFSTQLNELVMNIKTTFASYGHGLYPQRIYTRLIQRRALHTDIIELHFIINAPLEKNRYVQVVVYLSCDG